MKKKLIIGIIISLGLLLTTYIILIIKQIIPNPFLDTSDLVCIRDDSNATIDIKEENVYIFSFDKNAIIKSYKVQYIYILDTEKEAKKYYEYLKETDTPNLKIEDNKVIVFSNYKIEKNKGYYGRSKEQIKKYYEKEFLYECK